MRNIALLTVMLAGFVAGGAQAGGMGQSDLSCNEVLERWAIDAESVPAARVDECKGIKGIVVADEVPDVVPFAGTAAAAQAADPCAGPDAAGSVHCWGPWGALAPAAGAQIGPQTLIPADEYELRPELAQDFDNDLESCEPGQACGFATIVEGVTSTASADETTFASFDLASDGSGFVVAPGEANEIASVDNMSPIFIDRPDDWENMRSDGVDGNERSRMIARVIRNGDGEITEAADIWAHGDGGTGQANSGYFAWGVAMSRANLDFLNGNGVSAVFSGPMSVDNNTVATVTANFGAQAGWTGTWANPGYSFDAGGTFIGADMLSDSSQFSSNVVGADNFVRGVLIGQPDGMSIAHIVEVELSGVGLIRDIGLLRE